MQLKLMFKGKFIVFCAYIAMTEKLKINDVNFSKGKEKENTQQNPKKQKEEIIYKNAKKKEQQQMQ